MPLLITEYEYIFSKEKIQRERKYHKVVPQTDCSNACNGKVKFNEKIFHAEFYFLVNLVKQETNSYTKCMWR